MPDYNLYEYQELLSCIAKDDHQAFGEVYKRLWKILFSIAYRHLKDIAAAEDIVHDAFTSLWYNRHKTQVKDLDRYLAVSVKYLVLHRIRREILLRKYQQEHRGATFPESDPDHEIKYKHILKALQEEVEKLPEKCRLVFKYSRELGMPVKEIAREMKISPNTVKNHLFKALKQIRNGLEDTF